MKHNKQSIAKSFKAKHFPLIIMGGLGLIALLISLVINEPQTNIQMQAGCLVAPSQVVSFMIQAVLF